ncbi:hypothetical protein JQC92_01290 [Shewanella sp. 202IG2-18]|uniref:type I-F CRISPR-associated protein Csy2 n=1 Tax=Parashewanella hymeniacidonis TaxID=2807618 RepID=UPI001960CC5F|nr:type I-F CRISPR-associated protein Csy2 [Parashewanella hymeniacidonis]MBM7070677.1 hypothetical protein [Parashewanella hymeniacidonis]
MLIELSSLLSINNKNERNREIRERLRPSNEPLSVDGYEQQFCVILLNLGYSTSRTVDLLDSTLASNFIKDEELFSKAVSESKFFHTHNAKFPDIRIKDQVIRASVIERNVQGICSSSVINCVSFGYANNGNCVSKVLPLITEFVWKKKVTFLAELICQNEPLWLNNLIKLGLPEESLEELKHHLNKSLSPTMPEKVCKTIQLRFKHKNEFIAVTPVISHALSSQLQKLCCSNAFKCRTISHPRMTNAGSFMTRLGGRFKVLSYYPNTRNVKSSEPINLANDSVLYFKYFQSTKFINALREFVFTRPYSTLRLKRLARISAIMCIRRLLHLWIFKFIRDKKSDDINQFISELSNLLHSQLSQSQKTEVFAYHPKLLKVLKSQIQYVVKHPEKPIAKDASPVIYLHLKGLVAEGVNTMSNQYLWGMPSIIALAGFTQEFEMNLNECLGQEAQPYEVALFVHSYELASETSLPEFDRIVKVNGKYTPQRPALIDLSKSTMKFDLVIKLKVVKDSPHILDNNEPFLNAVPDRIMGGEIDFGEGITDKNYILTADSEKLYKSIETLPHAGCWLYPTTLKPKNLDEMSVLLKDNFSLKPAHIGYAFLEKPKSRKGAICSKHCFAESVLGLIRCVNQVDVCYEGIESFLSDAFWSFEVSDTSLIMNNT